MSITATKKYQINNKVLAMCTTYYIETTKKHVAACIDWLVVNKWLWVKTLYPRANPKSPATSPTVFWDGFTTPLTWDSGCSLPSSTSWTMLGWFTHPQMLPSYPPHSPASVQLSPQAESTATPMHHTRRRPQG